MRNSLKYVALAIMLSLALGLMMNGALTERVVNKWAAAESMKTARSGACAALLPDGRVLITGGKDDSGVLSSAEFLAEKLEGILIRVENHSLRSAGRPQNRAERLANLSLLKDVEYAS